MNRFCGVGILGGLVLVSLAGCSGAARDASAGKNDNTSNNTEAATNNSAPVAQSVALAANTTPANVGSLLTASYTYFDADGDAQGASVIRWLSNGVAIAGAQGSSYTLVSADAGKTIVVEVTPKAVSGVVTGSATLSNSIATNNSAPTVANVDITPGTARVNTALTAGFTYNDVDNDPQGASVYEWSNGTEMIGTGSTYTVKVTDAHKTLSVKVTPVASSGTSPGVAVISTGLVVDNSPPGITGLAIDGSVGGKAYTGVALNAKYSFQDLDGDGEGVSTYQWLRNGVAIGGATALNYAVTSADIGVPLTVRVTPKDNFVSAQSGTPVVSPAITPVNLAPVASNVRIIDAAGSTPAQRILAALYDYADHEIDPAGTPLYVWKRNGVPVASSTIYDLGLSDAGSSISVEITPVAQSGTLTGVATAAATALNVPSVNVALNVSAGLKQLHFSWTAVTSATRYRVLYNPDGVSGFAPISAASDNLTATTYDWDISVHRIDWPKAQFLLEACDLKNTCLPSVNISALNVMVGAIGYFKASNTGSADSFGYSVALSADGNTLAVGAYVENSAATGVGGDQSDGCTKAPVTNCAYSSGAVYVYTRSATTWIQQAYVKASNAEAGDSFGREVALSADGNTLAVSAIGEDSAKIGVTSGAPNEAAAGAGATYSGAVYVFTRSAAAWSQQAYVKASNTGAGDSFGYSIALSADGYTLAVGAHSEGSANSGSTPGAPDESVTLNGALSSGAVYVYARIVTTWAQQAYLKASNTGSGDEFGLSVALSSDGNVLAVGAPLEASANVGVTPGAPDEAATLNGAGQSGAVYVFTRSAAAWSQQAYVKASNAGAGDYFGYSVELSADGDTLAVGAFVEASTKTGVIPGAPDEAITLNGASESGAVYVFVRDIASRWSQQAYVKASNSGGGDWFGYSLALSADGNTLAVGAYGEDSANTGVTPGTPNEAATLNSALYSGAVYVYTRSAAMWGQQAYVKASNTEASDYFGARIALSGDGNTLAVGAYGERSAATGVNNTAPGQSDNSAGGAGAVYLY